MVHYHISSKGVFGINHFKLRNFSVVAIEYSFATVDRGSTRARMYRWSVMIYGSLQAEFMETKYNSHINGYGTSSFGTIVVNISTSINNNTYEIDYFIVIVLIQQEYRFVQTIFYLSACLFYYILRIRISHSSHIYLTVTDDVSASYKGCVP